MSFNLSRFFYLSASFVIGTFFFLMGLLCILLPWFPYLQQISIHFILENSLILSLFGLGFTLTGFSMAAYAILKTGRKYVEIRTGDLAVILDENVIKQYLETYWQTHFPQAKVSYNINFKKHSLQIIADLPSLSLSDQKAFLEEVKQDFNDLFSRVLGYPYDVYFITSFKNS